MIPNNTFSYLKNNQISPDVTSLARCYQPIIGLQAFGLYHYLLAHYDGGRDVFRFSDLLNHLNFGQQSLEQAFDLLMGMQLLKFYQVEDRYILQLKAPLSQEEFLHHPLYQALLAQKVGEHAVDKMRMSLPDQAYDRSKSFSQVFTAAGHLPSIRKQDSGFDSYAFTEMMRRHQLAFAQEKEDMIALHHLAETSKKNWLDLFHLAKKTAISQKISVQRMKESLEATPQQLDSSEFTPSEQALIRESKSQAPLAFLSAIKANKKAQVLSAERKCLQDLANLGLLDEVINVLVLYTLNKLNSANLNEKYLLKLGNDFSYHEVRTAEEALKRLRTTRNTQTARTPKKETVNVPEWSNPHYKDETSADDLKELEKIQQELLANLEKGD